jgi:hypothetical protein
MPFEVIATPKLDRDTLWQTNENLDDIKFGFEFEFASNIDREDFASNLEDTLGISSRQIRIEDDYVSSGSHKDYSKWGIEGDGSIPLHGDQVDIELVSPPRNISFWEDNLGDILSLIDRSGQVWLGTGLHITFSYESLRYLDPLKFALFINDVNIAKLFGRGLHSYAKLYLSRVKSNIAREFGHVSGSDLPGLLRNLRDTKPHYIYTTEKFSSINLNKLLRSGTSLIEIRSPGGADYVNQADDILRTCRIIASAIRVACNDGAYADVYAHKFGKLIASADKLVQEGADTSVDAYSFTSTVSGKAVDIQADRNVVRYIDPNGNASVYVNLNTASGCSVNIENSDSPTSLAWVSRVLPAIVKCPVGSNFPGLPDDLYLKVTAMFSSLSEEDKEAAEYIGTSYYHRPSKMSLSSSVEEYLKKSIKPTADSILAIVNTVTNGGSISPIQADYLLGAFYKTQGKPSDIPYTPEVISKLKDHLDIMVPAVVRYAASTSDVGVFAKTLALVADSHLVHEAVVTGSIHSFVDSYNLQDFVTNGSLLTAPLTLKHHTEVPTKYVDLFDAAVRTKVSEYIRTAEPSTLSSIALNALRNTHTRETLNTSMLALFSYPALIPVVKDKISSFDTLASIGIKNLSDYIWVVDILPITDAEKLAIWAKQSLTCSANAIKTLSASVDPDMLHKWVLASAQNTEVKNVALKKNAVILFGAILHQGPAALAAYDAIMGMYVTLPDNLRDQLTRYVFQQLQEAGISSPRQALWRVLVKYLTATLHSLAELPGEDAKIMQRSRNLVMFLDESDRYLGSGSSYWRADRRQHVTDLNNILDIGGSVNDGHATVGMLSDVEPGSTVTIESLHNNEDDVVSPVVLPYIIEYVRGIKEAIKNIESRPTT